MGFCRVRLAQRPGFQILMLTLGLAWQKSGALERVSMAPDACGCIQPGCG